MLSPPDDAPQDDADLRRLIAKLETLAADPGKAPACRALLAKLSPYLPVQPAPPRRAA